jgi:hypothetical protein
LDRDRTGKATSGFPCFSIFVSMEEATPAIAWSVTRSRRAFSDWGDFIGKLLSSGGVAG